MGAGIGVVTTAISIAADGAKLAIEAPVRVVDTVANIKLLPELPKIPIPEVSVRI